MSTSAGDLPNISVSLLHDMFNSSSQSSTPSTTPPSCSIDESYKYIFLPICYSFTFIFSILLNSVVLYRSFRQTKRWNASLIYMVNLASTDFMYGLSLPFLVASYIMRDRWIFGDFMCRLVRFLFYFNLYCSIFFLTCISVHRYLGICHPMKVISLETKKAVKCTCVLVWIVVFALTCPIFRFAQTGHVTRLGGVGATVNNSDNPSYEMSLINGNGSHGHLGGIIEEYQNCWDDAIDKEFADYVPYGIILHLLGFFVPFSIIAWCYSHVVLTIFRTLHSRPSSHRGPRGGGHEGLEKREKASSAIFGKERKGSNGIARAVRRDEGISIFLGARSPYANRRRKSIKTIITITFLFALCFLPFHVTRTIFLLLKVTKRVPCQTMTMVSMCYKITRPLASFNAWLNALLYFLTKDKGGAHCCQTVDSNTQQQHGGLLLPLRMMGKGEDAEDGGREDGVDNREKKALHNSPSYTNRAKVRYIVDIEK
ncbi:P2Y purinoceptor 3 [Solea solea]|uniref:P2Y purinoceptor 3 n=1 Tax=Solea solea TaxID=90069 RepID=UPI0027296CF8|nr:P2Y purinoceptor 3 [Solea solea]